MAKNADWYYKDKKVQLPQEDNKDKYKHNIENAFEMYYQSLVKEGLSNNPEIKKKVLATYINLLRKFYNLGVADGQTSAAEYLKLGASAVISGESSKRISDIRKALEEKVYELLTESKGKSASGDGLAVWEKTEDPCCGEKKNIKLMGGF